MFIQTIIHTQAACNYLTVKYKYEYNIQSKTGMVETEIMPSKLSVTLQLSLTLLLQSTCASRVTVTAICIYLLLKLKFHVRSMLC
jgi:hypothetical protein